VGLSGVSSRPEDTVLTDRAYSFLTAGPADASSLISYVCNLPGAPKLVAEHIASTLFAGRREFMKDADGRWLLRASHASANATLAAELVTPVTLPATLPSAPDRATDTVGPLVATPASTGILLRDLSFVVVDVETTGGGFYSGHRITEFAAVSVRNGEIDDVFETLVNPERSIPPWISKLTNITWDMVKDAPRFRDIGDRVIQSLEGKVFVAHNAGFDWRFVTAEVQRATGRHLDGPRLCTVRLARKLLSQLRSRSLGSLANYYGIENSARHRAAGDAIATAHVLTRLLREAQDRGCSTWEELQKLMNARGGKKRRTRRPPASPKSTEHDTSA
jgi:DNA polymerase III subunit epsilon